METREILCRGCGQTNLRYEGGWLAWFRQPRRPWECDFCCATLRTGKIDWWYWPFRIIQVAMYYFLYSLIFFAIGSFTLFVLLAITGHLQPESDLDKAWRWIPFLSGALFGLAICEVRRRKGILLGGKHHKHV